MCSWSRWIPTWNSQHDRVDDLRRLASGSTPEATLRRLEAIMRCRERLTMNVAPLLAVEELRSLARG